MLDVYRKAEDFLINGLLTDLPTVFANQWQIGKDESAILRGADIFLILRPGSMSYVYMGDGRQIVDFDIEVIGDLFVRYSDREQAWESFRNARSMLLEWVLEQNAKEHDDIYRIAMSANGQAQYLKFDDRQTYPNFIFQTITFRFGIRTFVNRR